jgi:hypothetical protein
MLLVVEQEMAVIYKLSSLHDRIGKSSSQHYHVEPSLEKLKRSLVVSHALILGIVGSLFHH